MQSSSITPDFSRKPGENTIAYFPLNSETTLNDMKGRGTAFNFTNLGSTVSFGTNQGVDCADFSGGGKCLKTDVGQLYQTFTLSGRFYITQNGTYQGLMLHGGDYSHLIGSRYNRNLGLAITSWASPESVGPTVSTGRHHICAIQQSGGNAKVYCDNVLWATTTAPTITGTTQLVCGGHPKNYQSQDSFYGLMSEIIFESVMRTDEERTEYFDKMKSRYGIS